MKKIWIIAILLAVLLTGCDLSNTGTTAQRPRVDTGEKVWQITQELNGSVMIIYARDFVYPYGGIIQVDKWWLLNGNPQNSTMIIGGDFRIELIYVPSNFLK